MAQKSFVHNFSFILGNLSRRRTQATLSSTELRTGASKSDITVDRKYKQVHYIREINRFNIVDKPGPGVARVSIAITGAQTMGEGFKPRDLVPVSAILNLASKATGVDSKKPFLVVEAKLQDSVTGKILGESVYTVEGETFRLESSSAEAFKELAVKWVRTALQVAAGERARAF